MRQVGTERPDIARDALRGLRAYTGAERGIPRPERPQVATAGPATLRDFGGSGPPVLLVPSLINPPHILDLDEDVSLADAVAAMGRRVLLVDWGHARGRAHLDIGGHIEQLLIPLIGSIGEPPALIGYCLGGTMAIAAANLVTCERVATLASPWHFSAYPDCSRESLSGMWRNARPTAQALGVLPMEVLQAAFWSLDPERTVTKFARFAALAPGSAEARRFVVLEDWANEGEPLPFPSARELFEDLFAADGSGRGSWSVAGREVSDALPCPVLHLVSETDRIAPGATAPAGDRRAIPAGHVGMVVGSARSALHEELRLFLASACR